jgi:Flp pilus assembly protein TadD
MNDLAEGEITVKPVSKARRALFASLIAGTTIASTGCSSGGGFSLASMNPFSKSESAEVQKSGDAPGMTESFASMTDNARNGMTTFGASARGAVDRTNSAVAGVFRNPAETAPESDPLSLSNKPEKVNAEVYVANGILWEKQGDLTKAMENYTKALENEPDNAEALSSIARLHYRQGKYQKANEYFGRALKHGPNDAELHNDIALTLSKLNDSTGSIASFEKALKLAPNTSRYANNLATVHYESGDPASAYRVLVTNNKPAVAHFNMAYLHFKSGQMAEAKKHLNGAVQFESQASTDAIVKRAVDRSREMLAQIDASTAPVAQAAPQATIAGGQFFNGPQTAPVQQTARSVNPKPATQQSAPATAAITPPAPTYVPANPALTAKPTRPAAATAPATPTWNRQPAPATQPATKPVRPAAPVTVPTTAPVDASAVGSNSDSAGDAVGPAFPFSLPQGFHPQN